MEVLDFLKIKRDICPKRCHCVKCEFYYGCTQISNASDKDLDEVILNAEKYKELRK